MICTNYRRVGSKGALSLANLREESYDIIAASIKYSGDTFVPYKEVGDTFVPYMEAWFPRASND